MDTLKKKSLFWDIETETLDATENAHFIIERILSRGDIDDIKWASKKYGAETLKKKFLHARNLSPKTHNFWHLYFGTEKQSCTHTHFQKIRSAFWQK